MRIGEGIVKKNGKINKFKEQKIKRNIIFLTTNFSILILSGIYLYKTFAVYATKKQFNVINGNVTDPGDIYFAYYVDDKITADIPSVGSGYTLDNKKSECTNGVIPDWDNESWTFKGNYTNYNATDYTRTRCNLYFKKIDMTLTDYIKDIANYNTKDIAIDEVGGNIRYIGSNPNNYVSIDGELWRIIGAMKNIDDGTGSKSDRVKLVRNESIGAYSWDTSVSSINNGEGINEWSTSAIMKLLNSGYESGLIGGSLYWNSRSGTCYNAKNNGTTACDFTSTGLSKTLKTFIGNAVWYTSASSSVQEIANKFYTEERSNNTSKICSTSNYCNDGLTRTSTWTGMAGLTSPSDYGYATSGSDSTDRATCLNTTLGTWNNTDSSSCKDNNWLYNGSYQWTIMPSANQSSASYVFPIDADGKIGSSRAYNLAGIRPVVYLASSVKISSGNGSKDLPFILK